MIKRHNKGFTLIEIVVSITLLALIALFMLPMSIYGVQFAKWNNIKLTAMNLAYSQTEWLKTLEYKDVGLDSSGYSPKGIVKENLYLNETGSNPKTIEGIDYSFITSIYWESARSSTGDFIANALKKADVIVKARDPITGSERTYSVMGTLIAFEGERTPSSNIPLKVRVITGEDFTEPAKGVKIIVNNLSNTLAAWGRTDDEGKVYFTELSNTKYNVFPEQWEAGDMTARPTGIIGVANDENWKYEAQLEIKATPEDFIKQDFHVDYPGYIVLPEYPKELMDNALVKLNPIYNPPEGAVTGFDLDTNLTKLITKKIWRSWIYDSTKAIVKGTDLYYFVENDDGNLWDGKFQYIKGSVTEKKLKLGFGIKDGSFKQETDESITLKIEFTSDINNIDTMMFSIYESDTAINYTDKNIVQAVSGKNNKFLINIKTTDRVTGNRLKFQIDNKEAGTLINSYGMKLIQDKNYCILDRES
ncbi:type IV pilus modification PilV family protein [Lutispora saccharofermentans]|uniref:Prepilin-type N-terminal cleavage/methylation domain-containing protein n=1 Tax=Lutispora saccharofermentans TaxID=3024236 RepID=A0ABT1NI17_9FIRM|nr:prepilin-type N-terminal cleavage/methylation domain-containing protein [Lutispora saccharofermentans]MCQ1529803.1 prepilin-type N-terminal cleavage/methylation domain-containing protein [Lutispora saccharofermentans]